MSAPDLSHRLRCDPEPAGRRPLPTPAIAAAQPSGPLTARPVTVQGPHRRPSALRAAAPVEGSSRVVGLGGRAAAPWGPPDPLLLAGKGVFTDARHAGRGPSLGSCIDLIRSANDASAVSDVSAGGSGEGGGGVSGGISFAPGTAFYDRPSGRGGWSGSGRKVSATFNLRPVAGGEQRPLRRFELPKATLPSMHYLSVSHEDFMDPRYAASIMKNYSIPKYFFKSKSNLLVDPPRWGGSTVVKTSVDAVSEDREGPQSAAAEAELGKEVEEAWPKTSGALSGPARGSLEPATFDPRMRHTGHREKEGSGQGPIGAGQAPVVSKPLVGEVHRQRPCRPSLNALRSLPLDSEVSQYVQHKKRVGLGRFVRFEENSPPTTSAAKLREASMYDLNNPDPPERPVDQYLSSPGRLPSRQRSRNLATLIAQSTVSV